MSIPKEPRQIMINLMYLVLTALLALNISKEILNAFTTLSSSIDKSNKSIDQRTNEVYAQIVESEKQKGQEEKVKPYRLKADEVVKRSDEMIAYLNDWKKKIIKAAGGPDPKDANLPERLDDIDATTHLLVEEKGGDGLRKKIMELRSFLLEQVPDSGAISPIMPLIAEPAKKTEDNPTGDWNMGNFEHMPAIAAIALFSKFQNDVRSSESIVIKRLSELAHTRELKFDTLMALAVPTTTYALQGEPIKANILLAAFNKANKPTISISQGGGTAKPVENGVIPWETVANGTGLQTVAGTLTYESAEQGKKSYPWKFEYVVGSTGASLQLDKMNVFYIGVENPVTVSAAGYSVEDVYLQLPAGATQTGEKGHYSIKVSQPMANFMVDIYAKSKSKDGAPSKISSIPIRIKKIPDPVAYVLKKREGLMSAALFREAIAPQAVLENFDFDAKFTIYEFQYSMTPKGADIVGPFTAKKNGGVRFDDNEEIKRAKGKAKAGDRVYIEGIKAIGPDGTPRSLNPIILTLN